MRRFVVPLLLMVLSVQFSWAAAASYCEHEKDKTTQHVGHHEHQHAQASAQAEQPADGLDQDGSKAGGAHADCASCHLPAAKTFSSLEMALAGAGTRVPAPATEALIGSQPPDRIERPKWQRA